MFISDLRGANDLERVEVVERAVQRAVAEERERCLRAIWASRDELSNPLAFFSGVARRLREKERLPPLGPLNPLSDAL